MQIYIYMKFQLPGRSYVYKVQIYIHECQLPKRAWNCGVSEACRTAVTWKEDCQTESEIICIKIIILNLNSATWENVKMVIFSKYVQMLSLALSFYFKYSKLNICNIFESWRSFATFGISPEHHFRLPRDFHWRINDTTYETSCFFVLKEHSTFITVPWMKIWEVMQTDTGGKWLRGRHWYSLTPAIMVIGHHGLCCKIATMVMVIMVIMVIVIIVWHPYKIRHHLISMTNDVPFCLMPSWPRSSPRCYSERQSLNEYKSCLKMELWHRTFYCIE